MKESKYWEVQFKFKYPQNPDEDIRVTGNTESLGNWDYNIAPKLIYDSKKKLWKTKAYIKIPASFNLEYKYLIFSNGEFKKWEEIEKNRTVSLPEKEKLIFSDKENNPETTVIKHFAKSKRAVSGDLFIKKSSSKNHFKVFDTNNNSNSSLNIYNQNSGEINNPKLIGKKRKSDKNIKNEKKEQEIKALFKEILDICNEISNFNNDIIKKEDQNSINTDSDNIETTLKINNAPIATIYLNGEIINKVYVFKTQKSFVKENEIISQLKHIKKNISSILNKLKKN